MVENYNVYHYSRKELLVLILKGISFCVFFGYLFYNSLIGILILLPMIVIYIKNKKKEYILQRKWQLNLEFKDGMENLVTVLSAGYSVENAFFQAALDLKQMHGENSLSVEEFNGIVRRLHMNDNLEDILKDFGERSDVEDIRNFAEVFQTAKRTGGDVIRIMRSTEKTIRDKIEVENEIQTLISGKRLEAQIMNIMPCGIICYLRIFSPGFLAPLYGNILGIFIMTAALIFYYGVTRLTKKFTDIRV